MFVEMKLAVLVLVIALCCAQDNSPVNNNNDNVKKLAKKSYVCPPNFIRLSYRCYYFSREPATWQDAYFQCRDLHSNLAIIKTANQDKLIRKTLSRHNLAPRERWLGGLYDWEQMTWKWAASGKPVTYRGFGIGNPATKEQLRWHCIVVDPNLQYKWNSKSCVEEKHFICHTKIKTVTGREKKRLLRQYGVNDENKLNEIPVPEIANDIYNGTTFYKKHQLHGKSLGNNAQFASKPRERKRKNRKARRKRVRTNEIEVPTRLANGTIVYNTETRTKPRINNKNGKSDKDLSMEWKTYYKDARMSPLHPKPIVEEFNYVKES